VQVVDVLQDAIFERGAKCYVVEDREVLDVLAQPHAPRVRTYWDAELRSQEQDRYDLVHPAKPTGVYLAEAYGA
jgi:hypothetical protein